MSRRSKAVTFCVSLQHLYHWLDDAARFVVYPANGATGLVRLEARWSLADASMEA